MLDMEQVLKRDTTVAEYFLTLADVHLAATKPGRSRAALEKCLSLDPKNKLAYEKLAELYFIAQQYKEAIANLDEVLKLDITNPKAYFMKGMCFRDMGDTSRAISSFQTAVEQKPDYYDAELQLAILYHAKKDPLALQYYNAALRMNPKAKDVLYNRGLWYQDVERNYDQAIQDYTSAVTIDPTYAEAHFALGFLHYQFLKVYDQAIRHYTDAINAQQGWAEAWYNRGLCYEALGNIAAASSDYSKALEIYPDYSLAREGKIRVTR
jgi:tetratricopeptide (TPR) repeat protein